MDGDTHRAKIRDLAGGQGDAVHVGGIMDEDAAITGKEADIIGPKRGKRDGSGKMDAPTGLSSAQAIHFEQGIGGAGTSVDGKIAVGKNVGRGGAEITGHGFIKANDRDVV